jgi:hypothetical protein
MPFKGEVIVSPDWKINSVCDDTSGLFKPQLNLGLVTGGVVEYGNVQGIAPQLKIDGNKIVKNCGRQRDTPSRPPADSSGRTA